MYLLWEINIKNINLNLKLLEIAVSELIFKQNLSFNQFKKKHFFSLFSAVQTIGLCRRWFIIRVDNYYLPERKTIGLPDTWLMYSLCKRHVVSIKSFPLYRVYCIVLIIHKQNGKSRITEIPNSKENTKSKNFSKGKRSNTSHER